MAQTKKTGGGRRTSSRGPAGPRTQPKTFTSTEAAEAAADQDAAPDLDPAEVKALLGGGIVLTPQRVQEIVDEAVSRGRMVRKDAEELVVALLSVGRQQTQDLVEQLLERARTTASQTTGGALGTVDRARRKVSGGASFPIAGYEDLTAAEVTKRLGDLSPSQLRAVREHERRNANRSSVLKAVDKRLAAAPGS